MIDKVKAHFFPIIIALIVLSGAVLLLSLYPAAPKSYRLIYITKTKDKLAFWNTMQIGMDVDAKETGAAVTTYRPESESDIEGQNALILKAIEEKPDAVLLSALDYDLQNELCETITKAGIPLITIDSDISSGAKSSYVGTDNYNAGGALAEALKKEVEADAKIALVSFIKTSKPGIDREAGFIDNLTEQQRSSLVGPYYCESNYEKASEITRKILEEHPEIDALAALNESSFSGAVQAVNESHNNESLKVFGIDSSKLSIEAMERGTVSAIVVQKPFNMGYLGVKTAVDLLNGKKVPNQVDTGVNTITKENMYETENQQLLFIFADEN